MRDHKIQSRASVRTFLVALLLTITAVSAWSLDSGFPQSFDVDARYLEEIHVSGSGSDSSGDGTTRSPYATIGHALSRATAGSLVRVRAGEYRSVGYVADLHGTKEHPIAIVADGEVVIDARGSGSAMQISNSSYLVIQGLTFQNTAIHGLNIDDGGDYATPAHHIVLRDLTFRNIGSGGNNDCLKMSGVDDFYITGSEFSECNRGEAIDMVGCHNGIITANYFHDVAQNGVQTKGGSSDVLIHGNRFEDIPQRAINAGGSTGAPYFRPLNAPHEAARITMVANTFLRTGSAPVAFVGCESCLFANNTIVEPRNYVARILVENTGLDPGHSGYFVNNLIVFRTSELKSWTQVNVGPNTRPETYTFGWNLWFAHDDSGFRGPTFRDGVPAGINSLVQANPRLISFNDGDYRIMPGSPAQGAGLSIPHVVQVGGMGSTAAAGAGFDFTGRRFRDPPAIGAFEAD